MAKVLEEEIVISFSKLVKDGSEAVILSPEIKEAIAMLIIPMIEEVVGDSAVVEVK